MPERAVFHIPDYPLHYIAHVERRAYQAFSRALRKHGLSNQMWRVLAALSSGVAKTIGEIADLTACDRSNLGRLLATMEEQGLVARKADGGDGRAVLVMLTEAGRARLIAARPDVAAIHASLLEGFSMAEREALLTLLRRLKANSVLLGEIT
ncbi:MAG: MarR family transcriptional regulator [Rhodobacteraceae bacterium]|nr:MarR family transcriptional regulator [Paracoccaceae bacterium]